MAVGAGFLSFAQGKKAWIRRRKC